MKKYIVSIALGTLVMSGLSSCFHHRHDISVTVTEDDDEFEMEAGYRERKTHNVQVFVNERFLKNSGVSIKNGFVRDEVNLDDNTTFYINTNPGSLQIRIDKTENSDEQCERIKIACEELKEILKDH